MPINTTSKVGTEPIAGYTLRKQLGAGGYGEVWLADAPGGLQKAVKLVYGTVDQSQASSELRSLQRIRQVYHPFLLSLERIEIVDNQVVIVTELAESSLLDRFEQCRGKGAPGIARANLLEFLRDTADALDFLAQKHSLQHLDVKPGNLLIIADRIKVADFGLIKDLHDQNQSLVGGLTPTYSAPEVFDGRPDFRSDQYSLAIVYMEMLTGRLPFDGKTTGELARQHIHQPPNLEALPPADRPVVGRALAKNPLDRFATCRQFIEQLLKTRGAALPQVTQKMADGDVSARPGSTDIGDTNIRETSTSLALNTKLEFQKAIDVQPLIERWMNPRCLFVGLGGLGCQALAGLREQIGRDTDNRWTADDHMWLAIDTDLGHLNALVDEEASLPHQSAIHLPLHRPSEYRDANPELYCPLSRRWLYNIPRSLATEGVRPLAILALLDHYESLKSRIAGELEELIKQHSADNDSSEPLRIYVLTSLHGGTGSGLVGEIGFLLRRILSELRFNNYRICAVTTAAMTTNNHTANLPSAAAICCLSELSYFMDSENDAPSIHFSDRVSGSKNPRPFDWVTIVDGGLHGDSGGTEDACWSLANHVYLDSQSIFGAAMAESRLGENPNGLDWLRTASSSGIKISTSLSSQDLARWCCEQTLIHASKYMAGPKGKATSSAESTDSQIGGHPTVSGDLLLTEEACDEIAHRLLRGLGFVPVDHAPDEQATEDDSLLSKWAKRLSRNEDLVHAQLAADIQVWRRSIEKLVQMRVYNWKQVEQIQLNVIEGILDFCENDRRSLHAVFEPFDDLFGTPEQTVDAAAAYLNRYSTECVTLLQRHQREGKALGKKLQSWCDSIVAEKALNEGVCDVELSSLPPRLQVLASRVTAVLESTVQRLSLQIVQEREESGADVTPARPSAEINENVNLPYILSLSSDLVSRIASEIGISDKELTGSEDSRSKSDISLKQVRSFAPTLLQNSGKVFRFVVAPGEQVNPIRESLEKHQLDAHTAILPAQRSLGAHVVCDAVDLPLPELVGGLWRPSPSTLQLAERLRTRVDLEWAPATGLLEHSLRAPAVDSQAPAATNNPIVAAPNTGTVQLPVDA